MLEVATLNYHDIGWDSGFQRSGALPYKHSMPAFTGHLDAIASSGRMPRLVSEIDFERVGRYLMITFDDGGSSALDVIEQLNRRGWKAHFFIITSRIGTSRFLDAAAIRQIRTCGHLIGSHSHTHPDIFRAQKVNAMMEEWFTSCNRLSDLLGEKCDVASVPGGDISAEVLQSADAGGIRYLFTSEPWLKPRKIGNCWILGRVCPRAGTPAEQIRRLAQFQGWREELLLRRTKVFAKAALGPLYRRYVQRTTSEQ